MPSLCFWKSWVNMFGFKMKENTLKQEQFYDAQSNTDRGQNLGIKLCVDRFSNNMDTDCDDAQESDAPGDDLTGNLIHWEAGCIQKGNQHAQQGNNIEQNFLDLGTFCQEQEGDRETADNSDGDKGDH